MNRVSQLTIDDEAWRFSVVIAQNGSTASVQAVVAMPHEGTVHGDNLSAVLYQVDSSSPDGWSAKAFESATNAEVVKTLMQTYGMSEVDAGPWVWNRNAPAAASATSKAAKPYNKGLLVEDILYPVIADDPNVESIVTFLDEVGYKAADVVIDKTTDTCTRGAKLNTIKSAFERYESAIKFTNSDYVAATQHVSASISSRLPTSTVTEHLNPVLRALGFDHSADHPIPSLRLAGQPKVGQMVAGYTIINSNEIPFTLEAHEIIPLPITEDLITNAPDVESAIGRNELRTVLTIATITLTDGTKTDAVFNAVTVIKEGKESTGARLVAIDKTTMGSPWNPYYWWVGCSAECTGALAAWQTAAAAEEAAWGCCVWKRDPRCCTALALLTAATTNRMLAYFYCCDKNGWQ